MRHLFRRSTPGSLELALGVAHGNDRDGVEVVVQQAFVRDVIGLVPRRRFFSHGGMALEAALVILIEWGLDKAMDNIKEAEEQEAKLKEEKEREEREQQEQRLIDRLEGRVSDHVSRKEKTEEP